MNSIHDAIVEGLAESYHEKSETWTPHLTGKAAHEAAKFHPNHNIQVADEKVWVANRLVADRTLGDRGHVRFAIKATTAAEAARVAGEFHDAINEFYGNKSPSKWATVTRREAVEAIL